MDNSKIAQADERITAIEAWTLARALAGYPMTTPRNLLSEDVLEITRHIGTLKTFPDREWHLRRKLSDTALAQALNADTESVMPGTLPSNGGIKRPWKIIPAGELAKLPKAKWLIPNVIPENSFSVLYGAPGAYKSFTALDWSLHVSQSRKVIYTIYEGLSGYWQRIKAWSEHNVMTYGNLHMCIGDLAIMDLNQLNEFIAQLKNFSPAMVVIDTLARAMTGMDENSSRDMGNFIAACEKIRQEVNCTVLLVHHTNKGGYDERGSIALRGSADAMIRQYLDDDLIITECAKMKDFEPFQPYYNRAISKQIIIEGEPVDVPVLIAADKVVNDPSRLTTNQKKVIECLGMEIFANGATALEIQETNPELGRGSINRILSRLIEMRLVHQPQKRDPYKLTADGLLHLTRTNRTSSDNGDDFGPSEQAGHASQTIQSKRREVPTMPIVPPKQLEF